MVAYSIKAEYSTGDSFNSTNTSTTLGIVWSDIDKAKKALNVLKEHHDYYDKSENRYYRGTLTDKDFLKKQTKPWFVIPHHTWEESWQYSAMLETDTGESTVVHVPYHGYFEHLQSLEIVIDHEDAGDDLRVTF